MMLSWEELEELELQELAVDGVVLKDCQFIYTPFATDRGWTWESFYKPTTPPQRRRVNGDE